MANIELTKYHPYIVHAGKELKWMPSDTEELYEKNLQENYNLLKKFNWIDSDITYKFNKEGFRSNEFSVSDSIIFLGGSDPFGIGMPVDKIYPHIVSEKLGLAYVNLGLPNASNDTAFRLAYIWIKSKKLKPKVVVLQTPPENRFELLIHDRGSDSIESRFINTMDQLVDRTKEPLWLSTDQNGLCNQEKNIMAIRHICDSLDIKFLTFNTDDIYGADGQLKVDLSRDLMHPGIITHQNFADKIINLI